MRAARRQRKRPPACLCHASSRHLTWPYHVPSQLHCHGHGCRVKRAGDASLQDAHTQAKRVAGMPVPPLTTAAYHISGVPAAGQVAMATPAGASVPPPPGVLHSAASLGVQQPEAAGGRENDAAALQDDLAALVRRITTDQAKLACWNKVGG